MMMVMRLVDRCLCKATVKRLYIQKMNSIIVLLMRLLCIAQKEYPVDLVYNDHYIMLARI